MTISARRVSILLIAIAGLPLPGCGSGGDRAQVSGSVSYDGQPLENGMIEFYPIDGTGGPSTGGVIQQGHYDIPAQKGPFVKGTYQVQITSMRKTGQTFVDRDKPKRPMDLQINIIPKQYNSESTLKVTTAPNPSHNQFDFDLKPTLTSGAPAG